MTPRHWLIFAFIAVLLVAGVLLVVAVSNRAPKDQNTDADTASLALELDINAARC